MFINVIADGTSKIVTLSESSSAEQHQTPEYRTSPIFPVNPESQPPDLGSGDFFLCFVFLSHPFSSIGKLVAKLNDERIASLWFSHGLASLIIISDTKSHVEEIIYLLNDEMLGHEIWGVRDNRIIDVECHEPSVASKPFSLPDYSSLATDVVSLVVEYQHSFAVLHHRASVYYNEHLRVIDGIHSDVCNTIDHLRFLCLEGVEQPEPCQFDLATLKKIKDHPEDKINHIQFLIDQILSINTTISYVLTQCYSGVMPILEHECPIRSFSLLGVGRASIALDKIYESVNNVFARYPIPRVLADHYETDFSQIPIFRNLTYYDVERWRAHSALLDRKLKVSTHSDGDRMCHLSYFSARFGFRETINTISAAIQSLSCGATTRWSLMTLTHEFLHAHVRAIMAVLFKEASEDEFRTIYETFSKIETASESTVEISLRKRLAFILLSSCESIMTGRRTATKILTGDRTNNRSLSLSCEQYYQCLKLYYKDINEYLVHTLDFLYFYEGNPSLYIKTIWISWSTIPEIQQRLHHYLLRTLLAVSVTIRGGVDERYNLARREAITAFDEILESKACQYEHMIRLAKQILEDATQSEAIQAEFYGAFRISDMALYFLHSSSVHRDIKVDDLQVVGEDSVPHYEIFSNEFQDQDINSPIAFILDKTRDRLNNSPVNSYDRLLRESCWELIVISSTDTTLTS